MTVPFPTILPSETFGWKDFFDSLGPFISLRKNAAAPDVSRDGG